MKLPDKLGPFEARMLAEVLSDISGQPAPQEGADVRGLLERADPSQLVDAARHLCLVEPRRFPAALLESLALGVNKLADPQLHQVVLPDWRQSPVVEGSLIGRMADLTFAHWRHEDLDPQHAPAISELRFAISEALAAARRHQPISWPRLIDMIETLFGRLSSALVVPDLKANPWGPEHAESWQYKCECVQRERDRSLQALHQLLALVAPDRSAKLGFVPSSAPDLFDHRIQVPVPKGRALRDLELAHALVAKLARGEPGSLLRLSSHLADFGSGTPAPLGELVAALRLASDRLLLSAEDAGQLSRRLRAVVKTWPKPKALREQKELLAKAQEALAKIEVATLPPTDGPLGAAVRRVFWSKSGVLHKVELEDGKIAYVRTPVPKLGHEVLAGHEVAISLLHRALGSDRAPLSARRVDGAGAARTISAEVEGYHSQMERRFDIKELHDGPLGDSVAVVAFVDLIAAASDLHAANLGRDGSGRMVAIDREIAFAPGAKLPNSWGGLQSIRFPRAILDRARAWTVADLVAILGPASLPKERIVELHQRLTELLGKLDADGRLHF